MDASHLGPSVSENLPDDPMDIDPSASLDTGLSAPSVQETNATFPLYSPSAAPTKFPPDPAVEGPQEEASPSRNDFTLQPSSRSPSPLPEGAESLGPSYYSPDQTPRNALLDLYKQGKTPEEGLIVVGNHIGEFLASIQDELIIPAMVVVPASAHSRGQATQLGNHWVLQVPIRARKGLAVSPFPSLRPTPTLQPTTPVDMDSMALNEDLDDAASSASGTSTSAPLATSSHLATPQSDLLRPPRVLQKTAVNAQKWICEACGYRNPNTRSTCRGCGAARDGESSARRRFTPRRSRLGIQSPEDAVAPLNPSAEPSEGGLLDEAMVIDGLAGLAPGSDPDLVIYEDPLLLQEDEPAGRRGRRREDLEKGEVITFAKLSLEAEINAARKEILVRRASAFPDKYLSSKSWPERKRMAHAHLLAFISDRIGEIPTWQEIPAKLHQNRLRMTDWPAGSPFPGPATTITIYKRDSLHNLCKAIWDESLKLEPWGQGEDESDHPALIIDTRGSKYEYEEELKYHSELELRGKPVPDLLSPPTTDPIEDASSPTPDIDRRAVEESSDDPDGGEDEQSEEEVKDADYTPTMRRITRRSGAADSSPSQAGTKTRIIPTPSLRTVIERRYFSEAEMAKGKQELDERTDEFLVADTFMKNVEWNLLRRMCRLHLSVYLNDNLGYTDFQDVPLKLREKHLRLTGWPPECDLPSGTHPANWKRDWVKALLLAIWGKTLVLEDWGKDEESKDAPLIVDNLGRKHWYNETADALIIHRTPRPTPASGAAKGITVRTVDARGDFIGVIDLFGSSRPGPRTQTPHRVSSSPAEGGRSPAVRFLSPPPSRSPASGSGTQGKKDENRAADNPLKRLSDALNARVDESRDLREKLEAKRPRVDKN
ncbi:hypothetical protein CALVIDRAFT_563934 [Calocera viscosa TUFC12733]|uniref:RanBP2-type domain-containing protein n=1 Tax=Calocera viscosa (strain TUFC12733) TaxID=1330018 RepID=A0A167M8Q3_CALVF|nr:hypothetical protein CALVIDRAFT_563934 [Calocera viscosa TUFC12733]